MRPAARMNEGPSSLRTERIVRAVVDLVWGLFMVATVVWQAWYGHWNWAWLLLGLFALDQLTNLTQYVRAISKDLAE